MKYLLIKVKFYQYYMFLHVYITIIYYTFMLSFKVDVPYNIITTDEEPLTLGVRKGSVRFFGRYILNTYGHEIDTNIHISVSSSDKNSYIFEFRRINLYLCASKLNEKDLYNAAVLICNKDNKYLDWELDKKDGGWYSIMQSRNCMEKIAYDKRYNGNYVHTRKCEDKPEQRFKIIEVKSPNSVKKEESSTKIETQPTISTTLITITESKSESILSTPVMQTMIETIVKTKEINTKDEK